VLKPAYINQEFQKKNRYKGVSLRDLGDAYQGLNPLMSRSGHDGSATIISMIIMQIDSGK